MVVYAFSHLKGDERKTFQSILGNQKASKKSIQDAVELLHSCGAVSYAKNFALEYIREAKEKTSGLRSSEAKDLLLDLIDYSVRRDN